METLYMPKLKRKAITDAFACGPAFPLPFRDRTHVPVYLPVAGSLSGILMDSEGRQVQQLSFGTFASGTYELSIERDGLSAGTYTLHLEFRTPASIEKHIRKLVVMP